MCVVQKRLAWITMDFTPCILSVAVVLVLLMTKIGLCSSITETNEQVCIEEVFRARCPFSQQILTTQARYGHIEISRCVVVDFGHLGCFADISTIVRSRCDGKSRCEIAIPDSEISTTKPCLTGLALYMDVSYVCIPATLSTMPCSGIQVTRRKEYTTSTQVLQANCIESDQHDNIKTMVFKAAQSLKIKMTISLIHSKDTSNRTTEEVGYIKDGESEHAVEFIEKSDFEVTTQTGEVSLILPGDMTDIMLISFQAVGCGNLDPPPHTWMERQGDQTTLGCHNTDHTWTLRCMGSKWIGSLGNCTHRIKVVTTTLPSEHQSEPVIPKKHPLAKEILFALIIGFTVFMCAVVITIGFVCLKVFKYKSQTPNKNNIELASMVYEGEDTTSWRKVNKNGKPLNTETNNWQQTLPINGQMVQSNGTLSVNGQKYYILDREDVNTLQN